MLEYKLVTSFEKIINIIAENPGLKIVHSVAHVWWGFMPHRYHTPDGEPCDPTGAPVTYKDAVKFIATAETSPTNFGKWGLAAFVAAYDGNMTENGKSATCKDWLSVNAAIDAAMKIKTIVEDTRPIKYLSDDENQFDIFCVGREGVTKIVPYHENGQMAPVVWFAIYKEDFLWQRIPAARLRVTYAEEL